MKKIKNTGKMKRLIKILGFGEEREVTSTKDGSKMYFRDVSFEWQEQDSGMQPHTMELVGSVSGRLNADMLAISQQNASEVEATFYCNIRTYNNKHYNSVRLYLPKLYSLSEKDKEF